MSLVQLYKSYNIQTAPEGDTRHYRNNWLNTECPFCTGSFGYHLGFNLNGKYYSCFRCGYHPVLETLTKLLNQDHSAVRKLIKEYDVKSGVAEYRTKTKDAKINLHPFKYPKDTKDLKKIHKRYLKGRGFDPEKIQKEFKLMATSPFSMLDKIPYGYRILAPIYWNEKVVSFQARDYSGKQDRRYLACPMAREILHHKHILYMRPKGPEKIGFCVEGIVDVWRFIRYAFATFGIEYTREQVRNISKLYDQVFIIFDPEIQAQLKALKLKAELEFRKIKVTNIILDSDPGDLKQEEADYLIKDLTRKFI